MKTSRLTLTNMQSAPDRARIAIVQMIRNGEIGSGSKIDQRAIAKKLNLTTAPLREALSWLESEGLLQRIPGVGTFCRVYTVDEIAEIIQIRGVLEGLSARRAAKRITEHQKTKLREMGVRLSEPEYFSSDRVYLDEHIRFHNYIAEISQGEYLIALLNSKHLIQQVLFNISASIWPVKWHDHRRVAEAVCSGDPDLAEETVRKHIYPTYEERIEELRKKFGSKPVL